MSERYILNQNTKKEIRVNTLPFNEQQRLVGAFVWLIEQDKKQNPELYKNKKKND
jgi:hypothetical protein